MRSRSYQADSEPTAQARKWCVICGRQIQWRAKWRKKWDALKYCSEKCRRHPLTSLDQELENTILEMLQQRGCRGTLCPSQAAKQVAATRGDQSWRDLMQPTRNAARRLANRCCLVITQAGRRVDPSTAKGSIRLKGV